ncbi:TRAF-interacting protein with FHA domain-containing protein B [Acomys russatus]|uniref:TRAF-interacting protein with FHA domain-containing protein B n=1 Tax=Acomys russatus TaxID=60746 RepID=UPI0021E272B3|nr:TRAF-interacting protein with FHA domain-containing protein B [Acomys russatus]
MVPFARCGPPGSPNWAASVAQKATEICVCHVLPRISSMERSLTVLQVSLYHPTQGPVAFAQVPPQLQHDASRLLVGRGQDAHLQLQLPQLSRHHLSLEPYLEKGSPLLAFCLKVLTRRSRVWINGLPLRYLEQVPLSTVNRISFSGIQMVVHKEGGTSLEAFVCYFHVSPSPLIYRPEAQETDEWGSLVKKETPPVWGEATHGILGSLHGPSQTQTAVSHQPLEEQQKQSSRGRSETPHPTSPDAES